jgi:hypothetical protein
MTLSTDLIAISSVAVGGGTAYPVVRSRITTRVEGPEQQNGEAYRVERWELTCHAFAADDASVATLSETVRTHLCKRGAAVVLTEWAGTRTLAAGGTPGGGLPGYPVVELADEPERCFGVLLTFTLSVESRIPQPVTGLVEHDWERTEETDEDGDVSITQRGTYRVTNGDDAQTEAQSEVIDAAQTAAESADQTFRLRWTLGPDASVVRYEFTAADKGFSGAAGVSEAQLTDRTSKDNNGRVVRTISGYAVGSGAAAWIASQAPTADATNIIVRRETSPAGVPDGRLTFLWEVLTGVEDPQFADIIIFGFGETIDESEQVEVLTAAAYLGRDPVLRYAVKAPSLYTQRTRVDFLGSWAAAITAITGLFDDENLVTVPRRVLSAGPHGLKTLDYTAVYMYATALTPKPEPRAIIAVT